jgi:hypothetical protein
MMATEFSESSYAFALTRDLVGGALGTVVGAPEFPTLQQEGSSGGGYDVKIPLQAVAVFFQFKVPQVLRRNSRLRPPGFPIPYYRIPLRTKIPNQHQLLLALESQHELVFYAAPSFHQSQELDRHYRASAVASHSVFFLPSDAGTLDEDDHHIAYCRNSSVGWCYSEPTRIEREISAENASAKIQDAVNHAPKRTPAQFAAALAERVMNVINRRRPNEGDIHWDLAATSEFPDFSERISRIPDEPFEPARIENRFSTIALSARNRLGCEVMIFGKSAKAVT